MKSEGHEEGDPDGGDTGAFVGEDVGGVGDGGLTVQVTCEAQLQKSYLTSNNNPGPHIISSPVKIPPTQ